MAGAVASMFWVDAELGSDIYLDGKSFVMSWRIVDHLAKKFMMGMLLICLSSVASITGQQFTSLTGLI